MGSSTNLWHKIFFLLKFFWGYLWVFRRPWKHYTVARAAARHIWHFEKVRCQKMGNFRIFFFLKISKYNCPHNYKFHKKLFLKALECYKSQNNFLCDLRTKGTRYEILKKKIQNFMKFLPFFWDFFEIFWDFFLRKRSARAPDRLKNYSYDVKWCSEKI